MKIIAFAATNHKKSINKALLTYTASLLRERVVPDAEVEIVDLIDYELPLYRQDREETDGVPAKAQEFYSKIGAADAVMVSFAEHNGGFTAAYKNLFDWMSRINQKVYQDKPMLMMAASPGARGGANVLGIAEAGSPFFGMNIKAKVSVAKFQDNFDFEAKKITNPDIQNQILIGLKALA